MILYIKEILSFLLGRRKLHFKMATTFGVFNKKNGAGGKKILFFPMGYFEEATTWEIVLMKALELRGHDCKSFVCESTVSACEMKFVDCDTPVLCRTCRMKAKELFAFSGVDYFRSGKFCSKADRSEVEKLIPPDNKDLRGFLFNGIPFGEIVRVSLFHYLRVGSDQGTDEYFSAYRRFIQSALVLYKIQKNILDEYKPDSVVVINGLFYEGAVLVKLAEKRGIRHVTYESGYLNDRLVFSDAGPAVLFPIDKLWSKYKDVKLSEKENEVLDSYLNERMYGKRAQIQLWDNPDFNKDSFISKYGTGKYRKVFCLFTNILWDSAAVGCDEAFDSLVDWVASTIEYFSTEAKDCMLIIRVHPAEIKIPRQESREKILDSIRTRIKDIPSNVVILGPEDNTSSYMIMGLSDCVLVNTSITGLEAATIGKPVVVVGKTHYKGKGFTADVSDRSVYFGMIKKIISEPLQDMERTKEISRRYAYMFFFRYMVNFPFFKQETAKYNNCALTINSSDDLAIGKSPELDSICSFIIGEGDLYGHQ